MLPPQTTHHHLGRSAVSEQVSGHEGHSSLWTRVQGYRAFSPEIGCELEDRFRIVRDQAPLQHDMIVSATLIATSPRDADGTPKFAGSFVMSTSRTL